MCHGAPLRLVAQLQQRDKDPCEGGERRRHEDERREPAAERVLIEERADIVRERRGRLVIDINAANVKPSERLGQ